MGWTDRTQSLIGIENVNLLKEKKILLFGVGGVGGAAAEALVRAGIGRLDIYDGDVFSESNLNRQIFCTVKNIGKSKAEEARLRLLDINPSLEINAHCEYFTENTALDFSVYDYIVDAIDSVKDKLEIIKRAKAAGVKVITSMGTGNKLGTNFICADISKTKICPLARVMRKLCKENGITGVKAVYSEEEPVVRTPVPASISFVPPAAGLLIASEVVKDLIGF